MVGIAILGAGIFAIDRHLPAIEKCELFELKAVYSRSQKSAEKLASKAKSPVDVYFDDPATAGKTLEDLLGRADIAAVSICLPILVQPAKIRQAIAAGKHVISEKPVAEDIAAAQKLLSWYESQQNGVIWAVAENFRFFESVQYAASELKKIGGELTTFRLNSNGFIKDDDPYFNTPWRRVPGYQGGFLLDGGVHLVAGVRLLLAGAGHQIKQLACFSAQVDERLIPVDTVHAIASTQDGRSGTIAISYGTKFKSGLQFEIVMTNGAVLWSDSTVTTKVETTEGKTTEDKKEFRSETGLDEEFEAFGKAIESGLPNPLQTPLEALRDLEIIQALLESGSENAAVKKIVL